MRCVPFSPLGPRASSDKRRDRAESIPSRLTRPTPLSTASSIASIAWTDRLFPRPFCPMITAGWESSILSSAPDCAGRVPGTACRSGPGRRRAPYRETQANLLPNCRPPPRGPDSRRSGSLGFWAGFSAAPAIIGNTSVASAATAARNLEANAPCDRKVIFTPLRLERTCAAQFPPKVRG